MDFCQQIPFIVKYLSASSEDSLSYFIYLAIVIAIPFLKVNIKIVLQNQENVKAMLVHVANRCSWIQH